MKKTARLYQALLVGILIVCVMWVYGGSLSYGFRFDDHSNIVHDLAHRTRILWGTIFSSTRWMSLWLNSFYYSFIKLDSFWYRLGDLLIHGINGLMVFYLLFLGLSGVRKETFFKRFALSIAWLTAGLFLVHPVQTQTVCYIIQGQLEGMALSTILASALALLLLSRGKRIGGTLLFSGALLLATGSKEIVFLLPLLLVLVNWFFVAQGDVRIFKRWLPLVAVSALAVWGALFYHLGPSFVGKLLVGALGYSNNRGNVLTECAADPITPWAYCISEFGVIVHYGTLFLWPYGLSVDYDWKLAESFFSFSVLLPLFFLLMLAGYTGWRLWRSKTDLISFGILWFFLTLLPRASIIPSAELVVDYKTYIPSVGILFLLASAWVWLLTRMQVKRLWWSFLTALVVFFAVVAWQRTRVWESEESFWYDVVIKAPGKARAHNNYALALIAQKRYAEALSALDRAIALDADYPESWNNRAVVLDFLQRPQEAIESLYRSLEISPRNAEAFNNAAVFLIKAEQYEKAEELLLTAVSLRPTYGKAWYHLGKLMHAQGKYERACECLKKACLETDYDNEKSFSSWAESCMYAKNYADAVTAFTHALAVCPDDTELILRCAHAQVLQGNFSEAEHLCARVAEQCGRDPRWVFCRAECAFQTQRYQEALAFYEQVLLATRAYPQVLMRMAGCAWKLARKYQAIGYIRQFLAAHPPESYRKQAEHILALLNNDSQALAEIDAIITKDLA